MNHLIYILVYLCIILTTKVLGQTEEALGEENKQKYLIGTGIYDITGPAAQINFMGYARTGQTARGIHMRLRARAFIMSELSIEKSSVNDPTSSSRSSTTATATQRREESQSTWFLRQPPQDSPYSKVHSYLPVDPSKTVCFVSIDAGMGSDLLTKKVVDRFQELVGVAAPCGLENLSISGTHTHSAPAGFLQYALYQITSLGYSKETMNAYVEGVAQALLKAYQQLQPGTLEATEGQLKDANINRSPSSYLLNPAEEREFYKEEGDTDKSMWSLHFQSLSSQNLGMLNWFAVHGTSMNKSNQLISGDNKGYASYLMEQHFNNGTLPGKGPFVAAFCSTNLGDVSPNTKGPKCLDTGLPCDVASSTCRGKVELCVASGPGRDMYESTEIIGRRQYEKALELFEKKGISIAGKVGFRHSFIDMSRRNVTLPSGENVSTCPAALGYSFAAGTTDGPGEFDFQQGSNTSNPFWNMIGGFLSIPTQEQKDCQAPKPILLNTGGAKLPYLWDPNSVPVSVFQVGNLFILNVPAEFTTMAGRRLRRAVRTILEEREIPNPVIVIAGLANSYTHYVTTLEEYRGQRYEAASTLYGPYTLAAYIQEFERITRDLLENRTSASDEPPQDLSRQQFSLLPPVICDTIAIGKKFGSVVRDAKDNYLLGNNETVVVKFRSSNPRNNQRIEGTFLAVDMLADDGTWETKYVDGDWCTKFIWTGGAGSLGVSYASLHWDIPNDTPQALYRLCHYGTRKTVVGDLPQLFYHLPDWIWATSGGSIAVSLLMQATRLAVALSDSLYQSLGINLERYKDFYGCSKTFLVHHPGKPTNHTL